MNSFVVVPSLVSTLMLYYLQGSTDRNEEEKYWIKKAEKTIEEKINLLK